VLCLLDPRVRTARYGKTFLESLPPYRMTQDIGEVESFFCTASVGRTSVATDPDGNQADS